VSETVVSAAVLQAERDQHEAGDRGQLELDQGDEEPPGLEIRRVGARSRRTPVQEGRQTQSACDPPGKVR
jgi:hypothetical protein